MRACIQECACFACARKASTRGQNRDGSECAQRAAPAIHPTPENDSARGLVLGVGLPVEARPVDDLNLDAVEAGVARNQSIRAVIEAGGGRVLEGVVGDLRAVGVGDPHALPAPGDGVPLEDVGLRPRGAYREGRIVSLVQVDAVPGAGGRGLGG